MIAQFANDIATPNRQACRMSRRRSIPNTPAPGPLDRVYAGRQPRRPHHIADWMEHRTVNSQAELGEAVGADKSVVSRWLDPIKPTTPSAEYVERLNAFFGGDGDPVDIFRHPMDDWMSKFLKDRSADELKRIQQTLEVAFPRSRSNT